MNTIFFFFKVIFSPFKTIYGLMTKKERKTHFLAKPLKWCLWIAGGFLVFIIIVVIFAQAVDDPESVFGRGDGISIEQVDGVEYPEEETQLLENNPDGSSNGINLQLIDSISTEGYVKEMLSLYRSSANGDIDTSIARMSLIGILGIQVNETTYYSGLIDGTPIPKSYIPVQGTEIMWKKPYGNFPAEAITLKNINHRVIDNSYIGGISVPGGLPYDINDINPTTGGSADMDINVFQTRYTRFGLFGGDFRPSKLNGWKEGEGRKSDPFYLPDNLAYINQEVTSMANTYGLIKDGKLIDGMEDLLLEMMYSVYHNGGPGVLQSHAGMGVPYWEDRVMVQGYEADYIQSYLDLLNDFKSFNKNVTPKIYSSPNSRVYATIGLGVKGWNYTQRAVDFLYENYSPSMMTQAYNEITGSSLSDDEVRSFLQSRVAPLPFSDSDAYNIYGLNKYTLDGNRHGSMFVVRDRTSKAYKAGESKVVQFLNCINVGHVQSAMYGGNYIYGAMLKYAGVGVDPTNPNTYMNTLAEGEWKPSGESAWMEAEGVDLSKITAQGEKTLNEGRKYLGVPYVFGATDPSIGLDCSSFVQLVYRNVFGIELPRTTYYQVPVTKQVSIEEAKPGDLVFYYTTTNRDSFNCEHVAIFMGMDGNRPRIMHAPQPGDVIKITTWGGEGRGGYPAWDIGRVPGVNE